MREVMTTKQVATYLHMHVMSIYKLARDGRIPAAKIGGVWRFDRETILNWIRERSHANLVQKD